MSWQTKTYFTVQEYLAQERAAEDKSEFFNGEIFAMTGASRNHNRVNVNITTMLNVQLKGRPCDVFASDMRVKVAPSGLYTYPDVVVVCGEPDFEDAHVDTLLNPALMVEVLSKSTEGYDRGRRFEHHRKLVSLSEYLLIAQDKVHVEHYVRQPDNQWLLSETDNPHDTIDLASIGCRLPLADVYDRVEIERP